MADDTKFTPRFGRPGDLGRASGRRFLKTVQRRAARLAKPSGKSGLARGRIQRGTAAGRLASFRGTAFSAHRMRRVVVKVYIARASKIGGSAGFSKHVGYLQRDGVDQSRTRGELYDRGAGELDAGPFNARSQDDRHQFRIMVSPEDGGELGDLKPHIRTLMAGVERDLGTRLDWVAVDHHNTGQPHTHIVIRGRSDDGRDLVIAKDYLTHGLRRRASDLVTQSLGPRRDLDIMRGQASEVTKDRWTGIDRKIEAQVKDRRFNASTFDPAGNRLDHALAVKRLRYLEQLGLAAGKGPGQWQLKADWSDTLKQMGRRGDIIRSITAAHGDKDIANRLRLFDPASSQQRPVLGRVITSGPTDELRSHRHILVDAVDGNTWIINLDPNAKTAPPGHGTVIEVSRRDVKQRRVDQTIARIAALNGGLWSDALHRDFDPSASPAYRLAHKRRLEALRRAGIAERKPDEMWAIGNDFEQRALAHDQNRGGGITLNQYPGGPLKELRTIGALTWLDTLDDQAMAETGFGGRAKRAANERQVWLRRQGLLNAGETRLPEASRAALRAMELSSLAAAESVSSKRKATSLGPGRRFDGTLERIVDAHQGRFALVGSQKAFVLTPLRRGMAAGLGRSISLTRKGAGLDWSIGRKRGPNR